VKTEFENRREVLATKENVANVHKSIYIVVLVQFLAIIGAELAIVNFMVK